MSHSEEDLRDMTIHNRILGVTHEGIGMEADVRHAEVIVNELGLAESRSVVTPGIDYEG